MSGTLLNFRACKFILSFPSKVISEHYTSDIDFSVFIRLWIRDVESHAWSLLVRSSSFLMLWIPWVLESPPLKPLPNCTRKYSVLKHSRGKELHPHLPRSRNTHCHLSLLIRSIMAQVYFNRKLLWSRWCFGNHFWLFSCSRINVIL